MLFVSVTVTKHVYLPTYLTYLLIDLLTYLLRGTRWCSWLGHWATIQKVAGSVFCEVI